MHLSSSAPGLVTSGIVHCLATERHTILRTPFAPGGHGTPVTVPEIESMIDVPVEVIGTVIPRACSDEAIARKPLRTVVAVRSAIIRRHFVITVGTDRRTANSDPDRNMMKTATGGQNTSDNRQKPEKR